MITELELFEVIKRYFSSIGITSGLDIFSGDYFEKGIFFKLPSVCVFSRSSRQELKEESLECGDLQNLSGKTSKQSHIHTTGDKMELFFSKEEIKLNQMIDYAPREIILSRANIQNLNGENISNSDIGLIESYANIKLGIRENEAPQVQLGKKKEDSKEFNNLRGGLYKDDLLIIMKYRNNEKLFILGIPTTYYEGKIEIPQKTPLMVFSFSPESTIDDALYQMDIFNSKINSVDLDYSPVPFCNKDINSSTHNRPKTNPSLAKKVIAKKKYRCEMSSKENPHNTFVSLSGELYVEAHHLIPVCKQPFFINKLDTAANIVPLCPNCHRKIHNARKEDVRKMVKELFKSRDSLLKQSGIEITLEELFSFYD